MRRITTVFFLVLVLFFASYQLSTAKEGGQKMEREIIVLYDNYNYRTDLESDWGFSVYIRGFDKNILFDTGTDGSILLANMEKMGIDPQEIDIVVISHNHKDHRGGLKQLLKVNPHVQVFLIGSFFNFRRKLLERKGVKVTTVEGKVEICPGVYSSGVIKGSPNEQALILQGEEGLTIITGCSHPGILNMIEQVNNEFEDDIFLVMGGFHLLRERERRLRRLALGMEDRGVKYLAPSHCTGSGAEEIFRNIYKARYKGLGVGRVIQI